MSRGRILLGISGAGATALAALFGNSKIKEHNYRIKMEKFRKTAKKVNEALLKEYLWGNTKVYDPEHAIWEKKFLAYEERKWTDENFEHTPKEAMNNLESFRNFCFEKMEQNLQELTGEHGVNPSSIPAVTGYWDYCLVSDNEFKQLTEK
ncbi:hypothetical protein MHC_03110 [Mycoplasma haemocanis str. Illinois]|uniref:Uncharacterized protein n=1 Tax=Mycoplasma haemocanis (strain Illinois) TaxID=1111676 RepID=H6N760_MYCHN|nr:hypothetical protein [Mycoplasma haemocanis]AEW45482.1 hypothetical protein MHC_03110 [Mycoplasma haemocanis str. Illinois]